MKSEIVKSIRHGYLTKGLFVEFEVQLRKVSKERFAVVFEVQISSEESKRVIYTHEYITSQMKKKEAEKTFEKLCSHLTGVEKAEE